MSWAGILRQPDRLGRLAVARAARFSTVAVCY